MKNMWIRFVLCVFVLGTMVDMPLYFFQDSWKVENEVSYFLTLAGYWFLFSLAVGSLLFAVWRLIKKLLGGSNHSQNVVLFALLAPLIYLISLITVLGLQLRFFSAYIFPSPFVFNDVFYALFGLSIFLGGVSIISLALLKIFKLGRDSFYMRLLRASGEGFLTLGLVWSVLSVFGISVSMKYAAFVVIYIAVRCFIGRNSGKLEQHR